MMKTIKFNLNGESVSVNVEEGRTLIWVLRTDLEITGPKHGCGEGLCGACTVLIEEEAALACQTSIEDVEGLHVVTIEGLSKNGTLHPIQESFIEHNSFQCGFCTPGMILKASSLLSGNPSPSKDDIISGMDDNLCRCGAHKRIVEAIETAAVNMKGGKG